VLETLGLKELETAPIGLGLELGEIGWSGP